MKKKKKYNPNRVKNFISNWIYKFKTLSFAKNILFFYIFITIVGSLFLFMPLSRKTDVDYIDCLFTSASAFSDTGLTTLTTATTWTEFGQAIIAILILVGGLGWFALKAYLFNILLGRPISFRQRETLAAERGSSKVGVTKNLIKVSVTILFVVLVIAILVLFLYFYFAQPDLDPYGTGQENSALLVENPYHSVTTSFKYGIFHAISALNNAGFDIVGSSSFAPYYHEYGLQIIFIILFVIGGMGFPVIYDVYGYFKSKITKEKFNWSLFTKVSSITYLLVAAIGLGTTFIIEMSAHTAADGTQSFWERKDYGSKGDKVMALFFNSMSTRNAGFATINMGTLSSATLFQYCIMMFIGSAPSSTAGGIRTTTMAIVVLSIWSKIRGRNTVRAFRRRVPHETVIRSTVVFVSSMFLVAVASLITLSSLHEFGGKSVDSNFIHVIFEVTSAFGTTGLSTGLTPDLSMASKLTLFLLMFIGQLGVSSTLLVWDSRKNNSRKYTYIEEHIQTG